MVSVKAEDCVGCDACIDVCPQNSITIEDGIAVIDASTCNDCGLCIDECPAGAILE